MFGTLKTLKTVKHGGGECHGLQLYYSGVGEMAFVENNVTARSYVEVFGRHHLKSSAIKHGRHNFDRHVENSSSTIRPRKTRPR